MSKKSRKSRPQRKRKGKRSQGHSQMPPDRRAMERILSDVGRALSEQEFESIDEANAFLEKMLSEGQPFAPRAPETPLQEAQELMYEAWDAQGRKRVNLARKALQISKDCADAYVLLAEEAATSLEEARELYQQGVQAGERALGEEMFVENAGHFWGILATRPYMRARAGLAATLWHLGQRKAAIAHLQEMLRLNPNDNQGLRYFLANCLLVEGRDKELLKLLKQYEGDIAAGWAYTEALLAFRRRGASHRSRRLLQDALEANPHVPAYLLGKKRLPRQMPEYVGMGDANEAVEYAASARPIWSGTPGALEWLEGIQSGAQSTRQPTSGPDRQPEFKEGEAVVMRTGEWLEDYELDMSGWQGWVTGIDDDGDVIVAWDSQTLHEIPEWAVAEMVMDGIDWTTLVTPPHFLKAAKPRDAEEDRLSVARERYAAHGIDVDRLVMVSQSEADVLDGYDPLFEVPEFEPFSVDEWLESLEIAPNERNAIRRHLRAGVGHFSRVHALRERYEKAPWPVVEELLAEPYITGYAALKILEDPQVTEETKINVIHYSLETLQPAQSNGVPYGLLTLLGTLAQFDALHPAHFVIGLAALEFNSLVTFGPYDWMEGVTKEALVNLANWILEQEELDEEERLWLVWKLSVHCNRVPHLGKPLGQAWLDAETVSDEGKAALCWSWLENASEAGRPPLTWQFMDAFVTGDLQQTNRIAQESGIDPEAISFPEVEQMASETNGDDPRDLLLATRRFMLIPPYLKRLAIPFLVRQGEDLEEMAELYWDTSSDYYVDALNNGIADAVAECHEQLSPERLRQWVERGIGNSRAQTRKTFYMLSTEFFGDEFLQPALQDNAKLVRDWAKKKAMK